MPAAQTPCIDRHKISEEQFHHNILRVPLLDYLSLPGAISWAAAKSFLANANPHD
jgi:hypothetical protein